MNLSIGVDFDNTIVCYDTIFFAAARDLGWIPDSVGKTKNAIRGYIQTHLSNDEWTVLQSEVYGARLLEAEPFPGVVDFFISCQIHDIRTIIISHKTRYPAVGKPFDLHRSAMDWLVRHGFFSEERIGLSGDQVIFTATRQQKIEQILRHGCTHFIDDLPEVFAEADFPASVKKILFDPQNSYMDWSDGIRATCWDELQEAFFS